MSSVRGSWVSLQTVGRDLDWSLSLSSNIADSADSRRWYAVSTLPQNEKSVVKHLDLRQIESFLPTCETVKVWKNRQRVTVILPLFQTYLFVRINYQERVKVLKSPGVLKILGNGREPLPLPDADVEFLRSIFNKRKIEPYRELVVGEKVRIKSGMMQGIQGVLVRKNNSLRFILTVELINQHAAVEVHAEDIEPILEHSLTII